MEDLESLIDFFVEIEKLKKTYRYSTCSAAKDSSADHSWKLAFMASFLSEKFPEVDSLRATNICLAHDLAEYVIGEIDSYLVHTGKVKKEDKQKLELKAMEDFKNRLSIGEKVYELWMEFEEQKTPESQYAKALDKMEVLFHFLYEGVNKDNAPEYTITYADEAVRNFPSLKPLLKRTKQKLKKAYKNEGIEWKKEYDEFP